MENNMEENTYTDIEIISDSDNSDFDDKMFDCVNNGWEIKYIDFKVTTKNPNGIWIALMFKKCIDEED